MTTDIEAPLGNYREHGCLGEGGFGSVLLVQEMSTGQLLAMKRIRPQLISDDSVRESFIRETRLWIQLGTHPFLVSAKWLDYYQQDLVLLVEPILPDEDTPNTLAGFLEQRRPVGLPRLLQWSLQFCLAMEHARVRGLRAHLDVKPQNLMVDAQGNLRVTDFGISSALLLKTPESTQDRIAGTPAHMAPEQFIGVQSCDARADIYSFGIVLFQLVSGGRLPFELPPDPDGLTLADWQDVHTTYRLPDTASPLDSIVHRCLAKSAGGRFQSWAEFRASLEEAYMSATGRQFKPPAAREVSAFEYNNRAASYLRLGDTDLALRYADKAIASHPGFGKAINNKAGILAALGRVEEAVALWRKLASADPLLGRPSYNLAIHAANSGDLPSAISHYREAVRREPEYLPAWVNLGLALHASGQSRSGLEALETALRVAPLSTEALYNKGVVLLESGRIREAEASFHAAVRVLPRHVAALNYIGRGRRGAGDVQQALQYFDRALSINPDYQHAITNRAELLRENSGGGSSWMSRIGRLFGASREGTRIVTHNRPCT